MRHTIFIIIIFTFILLSSDKALEIDAGAESVEDYSGCGCSSGDLSYTNNQAKKFIDKIDNYHTRKFWYKDDNAWNSDLVEDQLGVGGTDYPYGDNVHILLISGHGSLSTNTFSGYLCKSDNYNYCSFSTSNMYLGEQSGQANSNHLGKMRFLILCTCHSVDKNKAPDVWGPIFWRGRDFMYVMGYSGTSADSWTTDEVGEDFARKAAGSGWKLKQAWFWAIEDWWVDDMGALISHGSDKSNAIYNRDKMKLDWSPSGNNPNWVAWSWHSG
jgi:hypothetical protein